MSFWDKLIGNGSGNAGRIARLLDEQPSNDYEVLPSAPRALPVSTEKPIRLSQRPGVAFGNGQEPSCR